MAATSISPSGTEGRRCLPVLCLAGKRPQGLAAGLPRKTTRRAMRRRKRFFKRRSFFTCQPPALATLKACSFKRRKCTTTHKSVVRSARTEGTNRHESNSSSTHSSSSSSSSLTSSSLTTREDGRRRVSPRDNCCRRLCTTAFCTQQTPGSSPQHPKTAQQRTPTRSDLALGAAAAEEDSTFRPTFWRLTRPRALRSASRRRVVAGLLLASSFLRRLRSLFRLGQRSPPFRGRRQSGNRQRRLL